MSNLRETLSVKSRERLISGVPKGANGGSPKGLYRAKFFRNYKKEKIK